jgi:hypothetical protein
VAITVEPEEVPVRPTPAPFLAIAAARFVAVTVVVPPIKKKKPVFDELLAVRVRLVSGLKNVTV